jgi:1A family penicillin-binding protein
MAKSKQKKRKQLKRRETGVFYEALPGTMSFPVTPTLPAFPSLPKRKAKSSESDYAKAKKQPKSEIPPWFGPGDATRLGRAAVADTGAVFARVGGMFWSKDARRAYILLLVLGVGATVFAGYQVISSTNKLYASDISSPAAVLAKKKTGITIEDRNGAILYQGFGSQSNQTIPLADIPQILRDATLAAEDPSFYDHAGFSWKGTARAAWVDITHHGAVEGGSTLTQQLVKNAILTSDKSIVRKFRELILATQIEQRYTKDQILAMYLNEIYYGQGSDGVEAASQTYFHKPAAKLTLPEAALIAGLPLGPSRFDPTVHPQDAVDRRNYVLDRMASLGKITHDEAIAAEATPLVAYARTVDIKAPHFVFYVLDLLRQEFGNDAVENAGMTVRTTLDLSKQQAGEQIVKDQIAKLAYNHVTNGGLISLEPSSGDIISMVGSVGYDTPGFGAVNVTLANLQPGSSFKPIVYLDAFSKGWSGSTQVNDRPLNLANSDGTYYVPQNYDLKFRGEVTLRRALSNSLNIPAIETLQFVGIPSALEEAKALGITTLGGADQYGLSLVLGSGGVRAIDMATVYATLANSGAKVLPRAVIEVTDRYNRGIKAPALTERKRNQVADPRYVGMVTNILSDNIARSEEFGANSPLKLSRPAAAKTGTTNDFRDNWTVGYTPQLVTAVWVGNNDHSAMEGVDGITGAAPIWHNYMEMALAGTPVQNFTLPIGDVTARVCGHDGGLVNSWDTTGYDEVFPTTNLLTRQCGTPNPLPSPVPSPTPTDSSSPSTSPSINPADSAKTLKQRVFGQPVH